jgi:hypothetical protein
VTAVVAGGAPAVVVVVGAVAVVVVGAVALVVVVAATLGLAPLVHAAPRMATATVRATARQGTTHDGT